MRMRNSQMTLATRLLALAFVLGAATLVLGAATLVLGAATLVLDRASAASPPQVVASLSTGELTLGASVSVSGSVREEASPLAGASLALQLSAYPYRSFSTIARTVSAGDGSYAFASLRPLLDSRVRVLLEGSPTSSSSTLALLVDPEVAINASSLGAGRTRLSARIRHAPSRGSSTTSALWFTAARGTRLFRLVAITPTRELSAGLTYASATIDPPARRFVYRVCLNPAWERSMGAAGSHGPCPQHDYEVSP